MKKILIGLLCLLFLLFGAGIYVWEQYDSLDTSAIPVITASLDGNTITGIDRTFTARLFYGHLTKELKDRTEGQPFETNSAYMLLTVSENIEEAAEVIVTKDGTEFFKGTVQEWNQKEAFTYQDNGSYNMTVTGQLHNGEAGDGQYMITQSFLLQIPKPAASLTIEPQKLQQGDMAVIKAKYYPEDTVFSGQGELGVLTFCKVNEDEWDALIPAGYAQRPGEYQVRVMVNGEETDLTMTVEPRDYEVQHLEIEESISDNTWDSAAANWEFHEKVVPCYSTADPQIYWRTKFRFPVDGEYRVTTPFGVIRYINDDPMPIRHAAWDYAAPLGTPIYAPGDGKVEVAEFLQLSGNTVVIEYGGGLKSYFYHLDNIDVEKGQMVKQGEKLGEVGTTGFSTGPHLHCEFKIGKNSIDPLPLFEGTSPILLQEEN